MINVLSLHSDLMIIFLNTWTMIIDLKTCDVYYNNNMLPSNNRNVTIDIDFRHGHANNTLLSLGSHNNNVLLFNILYKIEFNKIYYYVLIFTIF